MSQWGIEKVVGGARFIPLVDTKGFAPIRKGDKIEDVLVIDNNGDPQKATDTLLELKATYLGEEYTKWQ